MSAILKLLLAIMGVAIALTLAHFAGLWVKLGGHPFWSLSATLIGLGTGCAASLLLWPKPQWGLILFLIILTGLAFFASTVGKAEFVNSYAENRFAGQIWYFGFIGFIAGLYASATVFIARITL